MARIAASLLLAGLLAAAPLAQEHGALLSPAQAVARAQERFKGELVDVELKRSKLDEPGEAAYEVKLITQDGDVIRVRIDAATGGFLEADGADLARARRPAPAGQPRARP